MGRARLFLRGVISGYATIGINILFALLSVPLALHYLGKEEFGLWVLITQLGGYLALLDLGMSTSIARFLADHKDNINGGKYGSVLKTGQAVFVIQGTLIAIFGMLAVFCAPIVLRISPDLTGTFTILMTAQTFLAAASFATRMVNSPLWCHQRYDINNMGASASLIANFGAMWIGFQAGLGIYAMPVGLVMGFGFGLIIPLLACIRLGLYPRKGHWGKFDRCLFGEIFNFGRDIFLMSLGGQLTSASQVILITRVMGLEAASVWSVSTKAYMMGQQFVGRIFDSSAGGLTELLVRNDTPRLKIRFEQIVALTTLLAGIGTVGIFLFNAPFVALWTHGRISWDVTNSLLLGLLLLSTTVIRCHTGLVGITKSIKGMKYIYLAEGITFVVLGYLLAGRVGFPGIIVSSILCNVLVTGIYALGRSREFFRASFSGICSPLLRPIGATLLLGTISYFLLPHFEHPSSWLRFSAHIGCWVLPAGLIGWFVGLPGSLRVQILDHLPFRRK